MTDAEKIRKAFAPLRASDTVVQEVLEMTEKESRKTIRKSTRTLLIAAVIAVLLVGTALAVTYPSWSPGLWDFLKISDEEAAALEDTDLVSRPQVSDTHDGVTVSLEQAVIDGSTAIISLRVEGLDVPEGRQPVLDGSLVTIDGEQPVGWGVRVFDDLHFMAEGVMYGDGTPAEQNENGVYVPHTLREDGSFEIDVTLNGLRLEDYLVGKEISVTIDRLGTASIENPFENREFTAEGPWVLTWKTEGSGESREWTLNEPLAFGVTLTGVQIAPLSIELDFEYPPLTFRDGSLYNAEGDEFPEMEPLFLYQLIMKDGTESTGFLGYGFGGPDADNDEIQAGSFAYHVGMTLNTVIDPDEVAALVFREVGNGDEPDGGKPVYYTVTLPE